MAEVKSEAPNAKSFEHLFIYNQSNLADTFHPAETWKFIHMFSLDDSVIKGAATSWAVWFAGPTPESQRYKPHVHDDADEMHGYFGTDMRDPFNLGGEIELWIEDEKYLITKSCFVYIPRGLKHAPWSVNRVDDPDRPVFHFMTMNQPSMSMRYIDDPRWSHLPLPPGEKAEIPR